jgi:ATP-dependent DNA helicase RecQ
VNLEDITEAQDLSMADLIREIEHICYSGTRLNLDYYIDNLMDEDRQDEIYDYFMTAETDNIQTAVQNSAMIIPKKNCASSASNSFRK